MSYTIRRRGDHGYDVEVTAPTAEEAYLLYEAIEHGEDTARRLGVLPRLRPLGAITPPPALPQ
jgi:hypothetical protein